MPTTSRGELHDLIEQLPESDLHTVLLFVRFVQAQAPPREPSGAHSFVGRRRSDDRPVVVEADVNDPVALALANAPDDDESSTADENALAEARWQAYRRGEHVAHEDVRREIGW